MLVGCASETYILSGGNSTGGNSTTYINITNNITNNITTINNITNNITYNITNNITNNITTPINLTTISNNIGNWSADKIGQNNGTSNLTLAQINTNMGNYSANSASLVRVGDANKTLVYCGNITGATSNLCTITSGAGASNNWVNFTTVNISGNGTGLKNITELSFLALANNNYTMDCNIYYASQNITNGISLALEDYTSTVTRVLYGADIFGVSATTTNSANAIVMGTKITSTAVTTINVINRANFNARIVNGASNTLIMPQYSGEVAIPNPTNNTIITRDSYCNVVNG